MKMHVWRVALAAAVCLVLGCGCAQSAMEVLDAYFRPDVAFPEFGYFWRDSLKPGDKVPAEKLGGCLMVYLRNTGDQPVKIADVTTERVSLTQAIAFSKQRKFRKHAFAASIYFSEIPKEARDRLISAGEPIWWKVQPRTVKPGECAEVVIRLRKRPSGESVSLQVKEDSGEAADVSVAVGREQPRIEAICFSPARDVAYLYVQRSEAGVPPSGILLDGKDITSSATVSYDPSLPITTVVCKLASPLDRASMHCFQVVYAGGGKATAAARVWDDEYAYGMWGAEPGREGDTKLAEAYLKGLAEHSINVQMEQVGSEAVRAFMISDEGQKVLADLGIRRMISDVGKGKTAAPWAYFLMDEPDAGDAKVQDLPPNAQVGSLGQGIVERTYEMREADPRTPQLLNVDMTFKPQNWYIYGQIPDIYAADPYYQNRMAQAYRSMPERVSVFKKATFVYAVAALCRSAGAPKPMDLIIFAGRPGKDEGAFRFATPQEKRIEAYYAIAAGAKGLSYWWFHSLAEGLRGGSPDPTALAQWREIGLIGAELRTAGPLIMTACPASVEVTAPSKLWTRCLARGNDALLLVVVNDDYSSDRDGTTVNPVDNADVSVALPSWLTAKDVFEISFKGMQDVSCDKSASKVDLRLGKVDLTRMIVITSDAALRGQLQKLYETKFAANVSRLVGP